MASGVRQLFRLPAAKPRQPLKKTQNPLDRVGPLLKFKWLVASVAATGKRRLKPSVTYIGVTGSCGKTTTTQLTGEVLSAAGRCFVNTDRNGPEGLSRSMLSMRSGFEYAIHELCGAWPGRIRQQTRILKPQIGVVTTVGSDHFKVYRTLEATPKEKGARAIGGDKLMRLLEFEEKTRLWELNEGRNDATWQQILSHFGITPDMIAAQEMRLRAGRDAETFPTSAVGSASTR